MFRRQGDASSWVSFLPGTQTLSLLELVVGIMQQELLWKKEAEGKDQVSKIRVTDGCVEKGRGTKVMRSNYIKAT